MAVSRSTRSATTATGRHSRILRTCRLWLTGDLVKWACLRWQQGMHQKTLSPFKARDAHNWQVRKLEYLVADALKQGCDTLVSVGGVQSNHVGRSDTESLQTRRDKY